MNEKLIITAAIDGLKRNTGLQAKWRQTPVMDGEVFFNWNGLNMKAFVEIKRELRPYQLAQVLQDAGKHQPFLLVAEYLTPNVKARLRENKIGYLDGAGNIYLPVKGNYIWIDGHKPTVRQKPVANRAFTKTGLRTVFYLLLYPEAINWPYRKLAETTGVALGNIKNIIEGLKDAEYTLPLDKKLLRLQKRKELLDRWMAGYQETLKPALHKGHFRFKKEAEFFDRKTLLEKVGKTVWGGEPAAEILTQHLAPEIITAYTNGQLGVLMQKWGLIPDEKGNVEIYEKFWKDERWDAEGLVPPLLVYVDLMLTGDPRNMEVAIMIYDQYLRNELG